MSNTSLFLIAIGILVVTLLSFCKKYTSLPDADITLVTPVTADRKSEKHYLLTNALPQSYEVFQASTPTTSLEELNLVGKLGEGSLEAPSELVVQVDDPSKRYYFTLRSGLDTLVISERRLTLEGSDNFRDLGGLPGADGKHVKWGLFYRADKLSDLNREDVAYLSDLGLQTVVDLRSEQEVEDAPDVLPKGVNYLHLPIYNEAEDTSDIKGQIMNGLFGVEDANNLLVEVNELLASSEAYRFQPFMDLFISGEGVPMVYHCTSGKDRTGFATYLILQTLGVDSALIFDDYLMSNYYRLKRNKRNLRLANLGQYVKPVNPEVIKLLMLVDPKYLRAAVHTIKAKYGTVEAFMEAQYGITDSVRTALRNRYLY